jgi:glycosyltransferase involved in cell wall biosynthesis
MSGMSQRPLITIVTPSFNQGHFIKETIQSILAQNYPHLEHLVMDGGSTDSTVEVLKAYPDITWVSEKDRGQTHAVNKGVVRARGEIIGWINSDDTFLPGAFEAVRQTFQSDPQCFVVYGDYHAIDENGVILYSTESFCGTYEEMVRWWDYTYAIHQPTVFVRKKVFEVAGLLDESFHYAMDYEWWLRVSKHFRFHHIPGYIATYRMHPDAKTFAPLEHYVYPEQLRASKKHWGHFWEMKYWRYRKSYQMYLMKKPSETLHNPALASWYGEAKKAGR